MNLWNKFWAWDERMDWPSRSDTFWMIIWASFLIVPLSVILVFSATGAAVNRTVEARSLVKSVTDAQSFYYADNGQYMKTIDSSPNIRQQANALRAEIAFIPGESPPLLTVKISFFSDTESSSPDNQIRVEMNQGKISRSDKGRANLTCTQTDSDSPCPAIPVPYRLDPLGK